MKAGWKSISSPTRDERGAQVLLAAAVADVPLARGDDLERLVALLVEVGLALGLLTGSPSRSPDSRSAATTASRALNVVLVASDRGIQLPRRGPRRSTPASRPGGDRCA